MNERNYYDYTKHNTFGGVIFPSDYERSTTMTEMADRIAKDLKWEEKLRKVAKTKKGGFKFGN